VLTDMFAAQTSMSIFYIQNPPLVSVAAMFFINAMLSAIIAFVLTHFFRPDLAKRKSSFFFLLLSFGTFIPVFGNLTSCMVIFLLRKYGKIFHQFEIAVFPEMDYSKKKAINTVSFGAGWATVRLQSTKFSESERKEALVSVGRKVKKETNLIYSQLVSDEMEELRICAFSLLEIQQDAINKKINQFLKEYEKNNSVVKRAFVAKQLALLYWELVYFNLAEHELRKIILQQSEHFAKKALETLTQDSTLWVLIANINLKNENYAAGLEAFRTADKLNAPHSKTYPYLAEISFDKHDYKKVKEYLNSDPSFAEIPKLNKIVQFWCPK